MAGRNIREALTPEQRATPLTHVIDPGFVNHRRIETIIGPYNMQILDSWIRSLPELPDWQRRVRIDHIYTRCFLEFCRKSDIRPLQDILATETGHLFCSTEKLLPCADVYDKERVVSIWDSQGVYSRRVEFHYSTRHIVSDTCRSRLHSGNKFSIIAELHEAGDEVLIFDPIVIGMPWLEPIEDINPTFDIMWWGSRFFENFIEDFDEFSKVKNVPTPQDPEPMRYISEYAFKVCLAELLGDARQDDWGGESSDYFTSHLHLGGQRLTAAFLLKGPHNFKPMGLNHLGKNNDQIVRLSHEPVDVLFVQHCHDILPSVRETLRAFAVQPSNPRRYCLIDGRDSLRLLYAYGLYDRALQLSSSRK